ncbi:MAG: CapA family protein [Actinomycetota bacterium]
MVPSRIGLIVPFVLFALAAAPASAGSGVGSGAQAAGGVTIAAVGDTILGDTPDLPPRPGHYLDPIEDALGADITFGNLEGTLTTATHDKCSAGSSQCFSFRNPPRYAGLLHADGFDVLNSANNHSYDFGAAGFRQTTRALRDHGIRQTGLKGQITVVRAGGLRVAFLGFAPYDDVSNLLDLDRARALIRSATTKADLVVVYMHAGAEGSDRQHVTRREEYAFGEDRGNPYRFAHMAVDGGADLVLGSGPHVLRGMEVYRHRLIAYSLGNFASYHNFNTDGVLALSSVLRVTLGPKGWFRAGRFVSVTLNGDGRASHDPRARAARLVAERSRQDFPKRGVAIRKDGTIEA